MGPTLRLLIHRLHLTLPVSQSYHGVRRPLTDILNRLQPNPYMSDAPLAHELEPRIRLRIQFTQYTSDRTFYRTHVPAITALLTRLPSNVF
ncbi:MAG: hypothetical protein L6R39_007178, partial [Caloplaca ligustica]